MAGTTRVVQFGLEGVQGPAGPAGPQGPSGFSVPVSGVSTIDPAALRINSYHAAQSIGANVAATGSPAIILSHQLASESSKIILQAWCKQTVAAGGKIQTLDGARRSQVAAGLWTLLTSGADVPDDTPALGCVFAVAVNNATGILTITGNATAGLLLGATVNEVW